MRHLLATLVVAGTCAFAAALPAAAAPGLLVEVDGDTPKWMGGSIGVVAATHELGVGAIRIMIPWRHGQRTATRAQQVYLHRAALTAAQGQRVVLAFYGRARDAPT